MSTPKIVVAFGTMKAPPVSRYFRPVLPATRDLLTDTRRRAIRHGLILAGFVLGLTVLTDQSAFNGWDVYAYWAVDVAHPYGTALAPAHGVFLYPPPMAILFAPLGLLPFEALRIIWLIGQLVALAWMTGPLMPLLAVLPPVRPELVVGNVSLFTAAFLVLALRGRATGWVAAFLPKITPAVGIAWPLFRGEFRIAARAMGLAAIVLIPSLILQPSAWLSWIGAMQANIGVQGDLDLGPLWLRLALAFVLTVWAARTGRPWMVPIALALSAGHLWISALSVGVGAIPLARDQPR